MLAISWPASLFSAKRSKHVPAFWLVQAFSTASGFAKLTQAAVLNPSASNTAKEIELPAPAKYASIHLY
jgi:hypothetical protein